MSTHAEKLCMGGVSRRFTPRRGRVSRAAALTALVALAISLTVAVPRAYAGPLEDIGGFFSNLGNSIASAFVGNDGDSAVEGADTKVDPDTTNDWTKYTRPDGQPSTQNVGRIWTDKSVFNDTYTFSGSADLNGQTIKKGDSDFLVGLSALSSTSNLKEMVQSSKPLDIVLVLDESTSMSQNIGGGGRQSRLNALKTAANNFIDATVEENRGIEDEALQHRLSIVTFSDNANTEIGLTAVNDRNADRLHNVVDRLRASGNTYPNEGFDEAGSVLRNARDNAQKVVIFFTDGVPAGPGTDNFDPEIATDAINSAHSLKENNTLVYSIGLLNGANPNDTSSDFNKYMNAVSSNYPDATATFEEGYWWWDDDEYNVNLGSGSNRGYYKTPSTADDLNNVFQEILDSALKESGSGSPIVDESEEGNTDPGTLTFTDQLGAYMKVTGTGAGDDKMQLAYGDTIYPSDRKTTSGNTDTYHFSGQVEGNAVYGAANLADLVVTVERSNDPAVGDKVTVQLPASLLPLRNYDVDTDNHTMTVAEAYPVRLFYGVSLKADAKTALGNPTSEAYAAIVASQASDDGASIDFYSNSFTKGAADGSTTASFSPNAGNKFYYYTQDTTLYTNPECTTEANWYTARNANTLYYKDVYWVQTGDGNGAREVTDGYGTVTSGTAEWNAIVRPYQGGAYYIPANTQRTERPHTLTDGKDPNATGTAANVLNPSWTEAGDVTQALGNNGKLSFEKPGSLEIKKNVDWGNASDQTKQEKNTFTFDITAKVPTGEGEATEALTGTYNYYVGDSDAAAGQVTFTDGSATLTVTGGTTVRIDGLPAGTTFTVTEQGVGQNGWKVTDATSQEGVENTNTTDGIVTGTIPAGSQASLTFSNTYHANEVNLNTNTTLKIQKNLEGRDWRDTDEFTFEIDGLGNTAGTGVTTPEPADTTITVNSQTADHTASFGDITFTMPGEYRYSIVEDNDTNHIAGIDYSGAFYRVVVTVTDNSTGNLKISNVAIEQRTNDDGVENNPAVAVQGDTVTFVNKYDADGGTTNIDGTKSYTDTTGGNPINADKFTFKIEALGGYDTDNPQTNPYTYGVDEVPLPAGSDEASHSKTVYNTGYNFTFGTIAFDGGDLGRTYEYKVTELAQNKDGQAEDSMTYDTKEYTVKVAVTEVTDADGTHIDATPDIAPKNLVFTNTYDPTDVTLGEDGVAPIQGTKTLDGRDMKDDETFYFQLTQTGGPAADGGGFVTVLDQPETVTVGKDNMQNGSADFKFSNLTFSQVGTYTFTVNEVADEQGTETADGSGMTYDTNVATVTVKVSDNHDGTLKAEVTYQNDKHGDTTDKALFANTYKASMNYGAEGAGGINVTKQMLDRPMANNEFSFTIAGTDSSTVQADEANAKLAPADKSFQNTAAAENGIATMAKLQSMSFDQDDAGKTFSYLVSETIPADGDKLANVAYDQSQYRVDIEVEDNGNGTMHTVTTVTKIKALDGTEASEVVVDHANSDAQDYVAPTFGFVNDYNPTPATVGEDASHQIQVTKHVTGADSATDYTFTLTATGNNIGNIEGLDRNNQLTVSTDGTIKDGESQTKTFGELTFTEPGTYTFTVRENQPAADAGWTFDDADGDGATDAHTVTVYVTDRNADNEYDGRLYIANVIGSPVEITNSYKAAPVIVGGDGADQQIMVQKSVTGADTAADFQFKIEPVNVDDPKWKNVEAVDKDFNALTSITDGVTQAQPKTATFAGIKFNATGEYQFKITEVGAAEFNEGTDEDRAGWTYDEHEAIVTVTVTDDNFDGQLDATVTYDNGAQAAEFTNKYEAGSTTLTGSTDFKGTKTIEGRNGIDGETFGFTLERGEVADGGNWDAVTFRPTNGEDVAFNTADATATMHKDGASADFWFDGTFTFAKAGTYTFNVTETSHNGKKLPANGTNGMTYDRHTGIITVTVTDDGRGSLHATAVAGTTAEGDGDNDLTFENVYAAEPARWGFADEELLGGHKYINDTTGNTYTLEAGQFSFTLRAQAAGNPMPEGWDNTTDSQGRGMMTVANGTGNATDVSIYDFGGIKFTHDDMVGAAEVEGQSGVFTKTFQYNIFETGDMPAGISRDNTAYTVTFTVTEDHNTGKISVAKPKAVKIDNGGSGEGTTGDPVDVTKLDFTNTYNPTTIEGHQNILKTLDGRNWQQGDTFTFSVSMTATQTDDSEWPDGAPLPSVKASDGYDFSAITTNDAGNGLDYTVTISPSSQTGNTYRFDTGTITYEREGVYTWTVSEQESTVDSVTSDDAKYTVKVTVIDENGVLKRSVKVINDDAVEVDGDQTLDFTNKYTTTGTLDSTGDEAIRVTKVFTGRVNDKWLDTDSFKAMLTAKDSLVDGQTMPAEDVPMPDGRTGGVATVDLTKDNHENVAFGNITYTRPGTYNYTLTEVQENTLAGVNYSRAEYNVVVTATDNGDGTMTVTSEIHQVKTDDGDTFSPLAEVDGTATFTNTYRANFATLDGAANLTVTKNLEGRAWFDTDDWTFTLSPKDDATKKAVNDDKTVIMSLPTQLTITGNTPGHTASFGNITFKEAGTYTFTVKEEGVVEGVTNDANPERTVVINVTDDTNGNLVAEVDAAESDSLTFTNTYKPTEVIIGGDANDGITVRKTLAGRGWNKDEKYSFTITNTQKPEGVKNAPMPADRTIEVIAPADGATNTAAFGEMTFSQAGTYVYEITEQPAGDDADASMTYDEHVATVTVAVFEGGPGHDANELWAQVSYDNSKATNDADKNVTDAAAFTNTQKTEVTLDLDGKKHLDGRDFQEGDSFTFNVTADDGAPLPDGLDKDGNITINPTEGNDATIGFGTITFTKAGEYVYHITEQADDADGMTYDTAQRDIIVTVTDDGQGKLSADITTGADQLTWTNIWTFGGATLANLDGTKTLTGAELIDGQFTFKVEAQNDAPMGSTLPANFNGTPEKNEDGSWTAPVTLLNNIAYTESGEYVYLITEVNDGQPGITYDTTQYKVTVTVNPDGTVDPKIEKSTDGKDWTKAKAIAFNNSYAADGEATLDGATDLAGAKILKGRDWTNDDSFTFILAAGDDDTKAAVEDGTVTLPGETAVVLQGAYSDGAKVPFSFGDITFTKAGTYSFTIREQQPSDDGFVGVTGGVTYDEHVRTITVEVSDNNKGGLEAAVTKAEGDATWTNTYKSGGDEPGTLDGKTNLMVTKVLDGRDWQEGDSFTFTLTADENNPEGATLPDNAEGITITNETADHQANFGDITFTQAGTYTFYVNEKVPADEDKLGGMTYDSVQRVIEVSVADNGDGTLKPTATVTAPAAGLTFTNTYSNNGKAVLPGASNLSVTKEISGRDWAEGDAFTFALEANDETTVAAVARGAVTLPENASELLVTSGTENHTAAFGDITFTEEGEYSFKITEVKGNDATMTYDAHKRVVTVKVTDNKKGQLVAEVVDDKTTGSTTFTNVYTPADEKSVATVDDDVKTDVNGKMVGVGDTLEYTIAWANNAQDENGAPVGAQVVITDTIPSGTKLVEGSISDRGELSEDGKTITWTIDADAAATGTVAFQVTVSEDAVNYDPITNKATIQVGENDPHQTNEVTTDFPKKTSEDSTPDTGIQVGDTLTYTIEWANLEDTEQNVTITDTLPEGLTYVDGSAEPADGFTPDGQTLTWTFPAEPGATGTVTFKALVNENATTVKDPVKNTATVEVGNNTYQTNTTDGDKQPGTGSLTISKEIKLTEGQGNEIDADKEFTFTLELKDAAGNVLTGEFPVKDAETTVKNGATVTLKHGESLTVEGLPEGAKVTVTEDPEPGYTADEATKTVTIEADETAEAAFVNTYKTDGSTDVPTEGEGAFQLTKVLTGKKWATGDNADAFTFELTPTGGTLATGEAVDPRNQPMPTDANGNAVTATTVSAPTGTDAEGNDQARFSFGTITYTAAGTYTYEVREQPGTNAGMDYDGHTAKVTVTVSDNKQGRYTASATVENGTFTNVYGTELDYGAEGQGGLWVVKNLENHNIDAGQFEFTVTAADEASAKKAGFDGMTKVVKSNAGTVDVTEDGKQVATSWAEIFSDATFTQDDADDTYTYTVKETKGGEAGYTNDATEYTVTITTADDGNGGIKVTTHVTADGYDKTYVYDNDEATADEQAVVPFTNVYQATGELGGDGQGSVRINATKQLANRDQVAGEFKFTVTDAAGAQVATGTNAADGTVSFSPISYTKDGLLADAENGVNTYRNVDGKDTFTYTYTVAEDTKSFDEGVTAIADSFRITVTVTDNNDGTLGIKVAYPDGGNGLTFRNAYGEGDEGKATVNLAGTKTLKVESGNNAPDIAGKYTFTLTGSEGAPMPEKTTVTNDAAGNVNFGDVTFTMENVFGGEATEDAGDTAADQGPTADAGNADTAADKGTEAAEGEDALMTQGENSADAAEGEDALMTQGENSADAADAEGEGDTAEAADEAVADEAKAGESTLIQAAFRTASVEAKSAKRSKTFTYTVTESGQVAGVTNDPQASRTFTVTVTDNGDGTLSVATDPASGAKFSFTNTYSVQPSEPSEPTDPKPGDESGKGWVTISKTISGRDLTEGEFQFALTGIAGTPSEGMTTTGTNAADGSVTLGEGVVFNAPGTYEFTIAEVAGTASGVTYDQTAYVAVATVTDNGDGTLAVSWEVTDAFGKPIENVTFENGYEIVRPGTVDFGAAKILDGRDLAEGEFSFELKDADGKVVQTAKNAADGSVAFEPMSFAEAGTYTYTISEVLPTDDDPDTEGVQDDGVTYDATVFTAVVTVVDNGDGSTSASVAYENGALPSFTNVYVKPAEPEPSVPSEPALPSEPETPAPEEPEVAPEEQLPVTGDYLPMVAGGIAVAAAGLVAGGVALRKRQRRGEE